MSSPVTQTRPEPRLADLSVKWGLGGTETGERVVTTAGPPASLGQLTAEVGHEFSRPLQVIAFAVDDLRDALFNDDRETVERCIEGIELQIQRTAGLVGRMLAFDRPDDRAMQRAGLNEIVSQALAILHKPLTAAGICLETALSDALPPIACCRHEMVQAILNLVLNALDAVSEREAGQITVRTFAQEDRVCVEIVDNGRGIAEQHLTRIFDPFFTTKPGENGAGLGLSITRGITRRHGGNLEASSKIGAGARVRLTLPVTSSMPTTDMTDPSENLPNNSLAH